VGFVSGNKIRISGVLVGTYYSEVSNYIKACLFWGLYEKQEARFIQKYLTHDLPVVELGASIGVISSITAKKVNPKTVYSIEANPILIPIIENNLKLNQLVNFKVYNLAIGNEQEVYFTPGSDNTVGRISDTKDSNSVLVPCQPLSHLIRLLSLDKFNLVCDIEGSEVNFLFQDSDSLACCEWMIIELHDTEFERRIITVKMLMERILKLGFIIIDSHGPVVVAKRDSK